MPSINATPYSRQQLVELLTGMIQLLLHLSWLGMSGGRMAKKMKNVPTKRTQCEGNHVKGNNKC